MTFNDLRKLASDLTTTDNVEQIGKITSAINELEEADKKKDEKLDAENIANNGAKILEKSLYV